VAIELHELALDLGRTPNDPAMLKRRAALWDQLAEVLWTWDAAIQDALAISSVTQLAGYNLGRALADSYWSLDPTAADTVATSWNRLLGDGRQNLINEYLGRLSGYFDTMTAAGISGSLATWGRLAATPQWRQEPDTLSTLHEQLRRWYGLLVLGQSPQTYLKPLSLAHNWRSTLTAIRAYLPDLLTLVGGLAAATALGTLVAVGHGTDFAKSVLGFLGVLGLTSGAITARLKTTTQGLLTHLRRDAYTDMVALGVTIVPDQKPSKSPLIGSNKRASVRAVRQAVRIRGVQAVTELAS
jgi:hypothetical protein